MLNYKGGNMSLFNIYNKDCCRYPVIVSIPHSGTCIPKYIKESMLPNIILPNMDWFLKELYAFLIEMNTTLISSNISRYVIDLNRDKNEDINGEDFWTRLVYTHNTFGKPLYSQNPTLNEIKNRIERYYNPYHKALENLIESKLKVFRKVLLLDLHSFSVDFFEGADEDISLSNYENQASTFESIETVSRVLSEQGYKTGINVIRGRYILKHYKELFSDRIDCIQMELRYSKYIGDRYYGEEELISWDESLFSTAQIKLKAAFTNLLKEI